MERDNHFGAAIAETYDARHGVAEPAAIDSLARLSNGGPALEFAIGTGRMALPLARLGIPVSGIELSEAMVAQMRAKPGGQALTVSIGDMTTTRLPGAFSLVSLVFNTIDNLTTPDGQTACFQNAAAHLAPGGRFVVETLTPPIRKLGPDQRRLAFERSDGHWGMDEFDTAAQTYTSHHLWFGPSAPEGPQAVSIPFRYAWPAEMDLMARIAGLSLEERWEDWQGRPFTDQSKKHISIWRKPA